MFAQRSPDASIEPPLRSPGDKLDGDEPSGPPLPVQPALAQVPAGIRSLVPASVHSPALGPVSTAPPAPAAVPSIRSPAPAPIRPSALGQVSAGSPAPVPGIRSPDLASIRPPALGRVPASLPAPVPGICSLAPAPARPPAPESGAGDGTATGPMDRPLPHRLAAVREAGGGGQGARGQPPEGVEGGHGEPLVARGGEAQQGVNPSAGISPAGTPQGVERMLEGFLCPITQVVADSGRAF